MAGLREYLDAKACGVENPLGDRPWLEALITQYAHQSDALLDFVEACFHTVPIRDLHGDEVDGSPHVDLVWQAYAAWAEINVARPLRRRMFEYALQEGVYERSRVPIRGGQMCWRGLRLRDRAELPTMVQATLNLQGWFGQTTT